MADEPVSAPAAPASPSPASTSAPPVPSPASTSAPTGIAADSAAPTPAPALAPADLGAKQPDLAPKPADGTPEPAKPVLASDEPTLLETIGLKDDKKPAEGEKPADSAEKPQIQPEKFTFKAFEAPEGVTLDATRIGALDEVINEHLEPQTQRDKLLNMHIDEMRAYDGRVRQEQQDAFRDTRKAWLQQIKADPELGGSGFDTTKMNVAEMRDVFASRHTANTENYIQDMAEFNHMLRYTGVGDHPAFWRFLNNVARKFKEPATPLTDIKPPPDLGRKPGASGRRSSLYDHPTSSQNRGR